MAGVIPYRRANPCPQCGHGDAWCFASVDNRFTFCRRVQTEGAIVREDARGQEYYLTRNGSDATALDGVLPVPPPPEWRETPADAPARDRIYRALLATLGLSGEHTRRLRERGLPGNTLELRGYATLPYDDGQRRAVVRDLAQSIGAHYLLDVPGFYKRSGSKDTRLAGTPGMLIPVRDEDGLIVACLIRVDETRDGGGKYRWLSAPPDATGCGPGLGLHVPVHDAGPVEVLRITEGPLKADIATVLSGVLTLGLPGVAAWKLALPSLERLKPRKILIAFDADARANPHVARPLTRIATAIRERGYEVALELWPQTAGKGIDDVLASGNSSQIRTVDQDRMVDELEAIAKSAGTESCHSSGSCKPDQSAKAEERKSQAKALIELAAGVDCFHSPDGHMFVDVRIDGRRQTWPIGSASFRQWLALRMYRTYEKAAGAQAMNDALAVLEARARFDGPERPVNLRIAEVDGCIFVDLANDAWKAVEISRGGWRVVTEPPVRFRRTNGMRPLPHPVEGGKLEELRPFLNVESDDDWVLAVAWLLGALRARGPYPLMVLQGEQGAAKSTTARLLRELIDPNTSPLRSKPRDVQELMITAINSRVVCYDNLSGLSADLSDGLCRLATGGGFSTRELYTDTSEVLLEAQRPAILTGITAITTRADLADRSLIVTLPPIAERDRRREADLWSDFEAVRPRVLGALFSAISGALDNSGTAQLATLPRMADFAEWVTCAEPALGWRAGTFMRAYGRNRGEAAGGAIDGDPVAEAVRKLVADCGEWEGSATDLLHALAGLVSQSVTQSRAWPKSPQLLSGHLLRAAPALRSTGIDVARERVNTRRFLKLRRIEVTETADPNDVRTTSDGETEPSVTENDECFPRSDGGDDGNPSYPLKKSEPASSPDPSPSPTESRSVEGEVRRVLDAPLVAEAIRVLEPEAIRVRLPDGRVWTALPGTRQPNDSRDSHANGVPPARPVEP
jgi:hypothetical protein